MFNKTSSVQSHTRGGLDMKKLTATASVALGVALASAAPAAVFFADEAAFLAATAGATLTLEDFENFDFAPTNSITTLPSGLNLSKSGDFGATNNSIFCAGSGDCVTFQSTLGGETVTFTFDTGLPNAFGLFCG